MLDASAFVGPIGGALCLAYAAGWLTAEKRMRGFIRKLEERVKALEQRNIDLEERSYTGQERQLMQVRLSGDRVFGPGESP